MSLATKLSEATATKVEVKVQDTPKIVPRKINDVSQLANVISNTFYQYSREHRLSGASIQALRTYYPTDANGRHNSSATISTPLEMTIDQYYAIKEESLANLHKFLIEKLGVDKNTIQCDQYETKFIYKDYPVTIYHYGYGNYVNGKHSFDSHKVNTLNAYRGLGKVLTILLRKYGFEMDRIYNIKFSLKYKDAEYKKLDVVMFNETPYQLMGLLYKGYSPNPNYMFNNVLEIRNWFMNSKFIAKESFFINKDNKYVGPAEYLEIPLFKDLVDLLMDPKDPHYNKFEIIATDESLRKAQEKVLYASSRGTLTEIENIRKELIHKELTGEKYSDAIIKEICPVKSASAMKSFRSGFETHISKSIPFEFYLLSTSADTIKQNLVDYAASTTKA